jgi:hypothetical protein
MAIIDVFKEAIKAILFFSWDGYFSWEKGMSIPLAKDVVKDYVANNADTNRFISLQGGKYICNFAASNKADISISANILYKCLSHKIKNQQERLKFSELFAFAYDCLQEAQGTSNIKISTLPFKPNDDYSEIIKKGGKYILNTGQSAVIKYIAEKFLAGIPAVPKNEIVKVIRNAEITTDVMRDTFRWNTQARNALLKVGATAGTLSLRF